MELLAPAGGPEAARAAVQNGADAVYLGFGRFNARRNAQNFTPAQLAETIAYCHVRGAKVHVTVNTLLTDRELDELQGEVEVLAAAGADAVIVQDLGAARRLAAWAPDLPRHASTQMTIHSLDGAKMLEELGFSRVVLARELSLEQIAHIAQNTALEIEVFVHGALCMCYSGQCYLSGVLGGRSGNRGLCAQPCRLPFAAGRGRAGHPLSLKDLCLAGELERLRRAGVDSLKIEGRMKRPEYVAVVTGVYRALLDERRGPTPQEQERLRQIFSRDGFTDGYLTGRKGAAMFGVKTELPLEQVQPLYRQAQQSYAPGQERPRVPVDGCLTARAGAPLSLSLRDGAGHAVTVEGEVPQPARSRQTRREDVEQSLRKTGGTPYVLQRLTVEMGPGLFVPVRGLNDLRRRALEELSRRRAGRPLPFYPAADAGPAAAPPRRPWRGFTVEMESTAQMSDAFLHHPPQVLYLPLACWEREGEEIAALRRRGVAPVPVLPRIVSDGEQLEGVERQLTLARRAGATQALCGNLGQVRLLRRLEMAPLGDFGWNCYNSQALRQAAALGIVRQTLSMELSLPRIRALRSPIDTELLLYGHLPLMVMENCAIARSAGRCVCGDGGVHGLTDRKGEFFPLRALPGCRNELLNGRVLALSDKPEMQRLGVPYGRLRFTIEPAARCAAVYRAYETGAPLHDKRGITRGFYMRGVE